MAWLCMAQFQSSMAMGKYAQSVDLPHLKIRLMPNIMLIVMYIAVQRVQLVFSGWMRPKHGSISTIAIPRRMFCRRLWIWCPVRIRSHWHHILCQRVALLTHSFCLAKHHWTHSNNIPIWLDQHHCHNMPHWPTINRGGIIMMNVMWQPLAKTLMSMTFQWIRWVDFTALKSNLDPTLSFLFISDLVGYWVHRWKEVSDALKVPSILHVSFCNHKIYLLQSI